MNLRPALSLCVAVGCLGAACARPTPLVLSYDLARIAPVAERQGACEVLLLGTPAAAARVGDGFLEPAERPAGDVYAWARKEAELTLKWPDAAPRRGIVDLAPHPDLPRQSTLVFLNDKPVGRIDLGGGRRRHSLSLPAESQWPAGGENRLRFAFDNDTEKVEPYGRRLSAAFYSLTVCPASDPVGEDLAAPQALPALSVEEVAGVPSLVQGGPSALYYAVRLPGRSELRFTPALPAGSRASSGAATLRITVEEKGREAREVWRGAVDEGRDEKEVAVTLPGARGSVLRLGLHVFPGTRGRAAWGTWRAPRILGDAAPLPLEGAPAPSVADGKAQSLRRSLAGSNVLLVILDAAGAKHFGCYGYGRRTTPEIDRIAGEGIVFDQAYTPAAYTLAAMASVWTSQHPDEHQNIDPRNPSMRRVRLTLPELLSANGVHTAGFVANSSAGPAFGFDRGFEEFREVYADLGLRASAFRELLTPWFERNKDRRFFAYVHFREPHFPYNPEPPFDTLFGDGPIPRELRRNQDWFRAIDNRQVRATPEQIDHAARLYDGNLAFVDREVGRIRETLEARGLWDRTVLIVSADHGEALWEHGHIGHSVQLYEESIRIPLIIRFPRGPAGVRVPGFTDLLDLAPTIADVYGLLGRGGSDQTFRGRSLLPRISGAPGKPVTISRTVWHWPRHALRDERFKLIHDLHLGTDELYDLGRDPEERDNLAASEPLLTSYYRQTLWLWLLDLRRAVGVSARGHLTPQQIENLRALGYIR